MSNTNIDWNKTKKNHDDGWGSSGLWENDSKNTWKGMAIFGLWIAFAIDTWACVFYEVYTRDLESWTNIPIFYTVMIFTLLIIYHKEK